MKHCIGNLVKSVTSGVILHQVNCQGVMGSGIAKELRETYPVVYETYLDKFNENADIGAPTWTLLGRIQLISVSDTLWVCNIFAQDQYGRDGSRFTSYDALDSAFRKLSLDLPVHGLSGADCHHPLIGCGLGGGNWNVVRHIIEHRLGNETTVWTLN